MLRSLFSGIAGLRAHQQMLDVVSNNIANVNTVGFKGSSALFESTLSQTLAGPGPSGATIGATNPRQIGLGVALGATELSMAQGNYQATGRPTDLLIQGDGFFMVQDSSGQNMLTRAGSFTLDPNGHLVLPDGSMLDGANQQPLTLTGIQDGTLSSYSIGADGTITGLRAADGSTVTLGSVQVFNVANPAGLSSVDGTRFAVTTASGAATAVAMTATGAPKLAAGYLEASNVDLSEQLTDLIIAQRGFQANSKVVTTSDEILQTLVNLKN